MKESGSLKLLFENLDLTPIYLIPPESPDWYAAVVYDPEKVVNSRRRLFKKASAEKGLGACFSLAFPGSWLYRTEEEGLALAADVDARTKN